MTDKLAKKTVIKTVAKAVGPGAEARAIHLSNEENHLVGIGKLQVVISRDGKGWFAQGLEIDFAAGGPTLPKVKKNFEKGLKGTIHLHLKLYETIDKLLKPAPPKVWKDNYWSPKSKQFAFSQVSFHKLKIPMNFRAKDATHPEAESGLDPARQGGEAGVSEVDDHPAEGSVELTDAEIESFRANKLEVIRFMRSRYGRFSNWPGSK